MFYVIIYFFIILSLSIYTYLYILNGVAEPSFVFSISFTIQAFFLLFFVNKWGVNIHLNTICIITMGIFLFIITCKIISSNKRPKELKKEDIPYYGINNKILIIFLVFCILVSLITIYFTVKSVGGDISNIGPSLYKYRNYSSRYGYELNVPYVVEILSGIVHSASYWFMYIFINNYISRKKIDIKILLIIIVCTMSTMIDGSRGAIANILLSTVPITYILLEKKKGYKIQIKVKSMILILFAGFLFIFLFKNMALMLGRNDVEKIDTIDYIAMYIAAPIVNLDTYLQEKVEIESFIGIHTFNNVYKIVSKEKPIIKQEFQFIDKYNLGNVYTIFWDFICDMGYIGVIIFTFIMACFSQIIYEKSKIQKLSCVKPSITIMIYSYSFGGILFSFFANKFFAQVFTLGFIKYLIMWNVFNFVFCELKIKYGENVIIEMEKTNNI